MPQMRRVEFPKIALKLPEVGDDGQPALRPKLKDGKPVLVEIDGSMQPIQELIQEPATAQKLHAMAVAKAGIATGYEGFRLHLSISAAIESAKGDFMLLDEDQWKALTSALEAYSPWPWYHNDVVRVIDAAKGAENVDVEEKEEKGPSRRQRRQVKRDKA